MGLGEEPLEPQNERLAQDERQGVLGSGFYMVSIVVLVLSTWEVYPSLGTQAVLITQVEQG